MNKGICYTGILQGLFVFLCSLRTTSKFSVLRGGQSKRSKGGMKEGGVQEISPNMIEYIWVVVKIMGPFLGTLNIRCRTIIGTQKGTGSFNPPTFMSPCGPTKGPRSSSLFSGKLWASFLWVTC